MNLPNGSIRYRTHEYDKQEGRGKDIGVLDDDATLYLDIEWFDVCDKLEGREYR